MRTRHLTKKGPDDCLTLTFSICSWLIFFFIPVYDLNLPRKFLSRFIFHWCDCRRRNFKKARSSFRSYCTEYHSNHIVFISSSNIRSQQTICAWKHSNNSSYSLATVGSLESLRLVKIRDRNQFLLILLFEQTLSALTYNFFFCKGLFVIWMFQTSANLFDSHHYSL